MPGETLCEACKRFFCGNVEPCHKMSSGKIEPYSDEEIGLDETSINFIHHSDSRSLGDALALPCAICSLAWNQMSAPSLWLEHMASGTVGNLRISSKREGLRILSFEIPSSDCKSEGITLVPSGGMSARI